MLRVFALDSVDPSVSGRAQDGCPLGTGTGEGSEAGDTIQKQEDWLYTLSLWMLLYHGAGQQACELLSCSSSSGPM